MAPLSDPDRSAQPRQLAFELGHEPSHAEGDFIVGDGNRLAYQRLLAYPHWPEPVTLIVGPPASGKSHLVRIFADRTAAALLPPNAIEAMAQAGGNTPAIIENAERSGVEEAGLFHLLNQSLRDRRPLLLTSREPVETWSLATDDVRSRLRRATAFTLEITDDIQLSQMFVKLLLDRQVRIDPKIIAYLVARMERSTEEVLALADLMDRLALARGTAITRTIAAQALDHRRRERGAGDEPEELEAHDDE